MAPLSIVLLSHPNKATVIIDRDCITNVGHGLSYPKNATIIDPKGLVLMTGLMDLHIHGGGVIHLTT